MTESAEIRYGRVLEAAGIAGYSAQRAIDITLELSESGEWRQVGGGFEDYSAFIRSIPFGELRPSIGQLSTFEQLANRFGASNRAISEATNQSPTTVGSHLGDQTDQNWTATQDDASPDQGLPDLDPDGSVQNWTGDQDEAPDEEPAPKPTITLHTHDGTPVEYPEPQGKPAFNASPGEGISWASWSWNPVTGCLHGCKYCYAREIATSGRSTRNYPAGFTPLFHPERLDAPANTTVPAQHADDPAWRRVFVCSMADLYGKWVPDEWINKVHASMLASPQWEYLLLTKFPSRYAKVELPPNAWVGTSVDDQRRVPIAERTFRKISGVKVKWLSLEPLLSPLKFTDLSMFDWVVIGAQTATRQPDGDYPAFGPPYAWVDAVIHQARDAGCRVHCKPNLLRNPGMQMPNEFPNEVADS
ncbi:MAG: DUF5131 family protein [Mycobacterium sp.]|nr:DUF5131 family protein [Mycobacterium sp.]